MLLMAAESERRKEERIGTDVGTWTQPNLKMRRIWFVISADGPLSNPKLVIK
jgi:hypothetical protein